jgi:hypothetical protein
MIHFSLLIYACFYIFLFKSVSGYRYKVQSDGREKKVFAMSSASLREVFSKTSRCLCKDFAKTFLYHREDFFISSRRLFFTLMKIFSTLTDYFLLVLWG